VRILVLIVGFLVLGTTAQVVAAKPKIAVAPFKGDKNNKVADALADSLAGSAKVTDVKATGKAVDKLKLGKELDLDEAKKLFKKLEVEAVVQGKLEKEGKQQTLKIVIFIKGKDEPVRFTVQFSKISDKFREDVSNLIVKKLGEDDEETTRKKRVADDEEDTKKKRVADDEADTKKKKKKRVADDDDTETKKKKKRNDDDKRVAEGTDDDGEIKIKKKRKKKSADDETPGPRWTAARVDLGAFGGVRKLTYATNNVAPRPVGTRNTAANIQGEVYPFAFDGKQGGAAGIGFAGELQKTLGLSITVPSGVAVPINQGHFSIGARYRIHAGQRLAIILGADFLKKHYLADRSGLTSPGELDAPDVDYNAVMPTIGVTKLATSKVNVFGRAGAMLIMNAGPIAERASYGAASVLGFDIKAGTDIAFSERIGLRLAGGFSQITFKFKGNGDLAMARGVTAAADRDFGLAATLGITY